MYAYGPRWCDKGTYKISLNMPQLIPFFFLNQLSFSFLTILAIIYILSKYILPLFTFQQVIRVYITKLSKKA
jgi:F-type H+-transporting ATPase subunit 8